MKLNSTPILMIFIAVFAAIIGLSTSYFFHHSSSSAIPSAASTDNIPVSHVAHYPMTFIMQLKNDPQAGKKIFHEYCSVCHVNEPEIPVHAPRLHYPKDWQRFKNMSIEDLFKLAAVGYGAMPARGGCFECTDAQLKQAIAYILKQNQKSAVKAPIQTHDGDAR